jgi:YegS/Rv2252/BmrU family lipid kinase
MPEKNKLNTDIFLIVNPRARNGKASKDWTIIVSLFKKASISFHFEFTKHKMHAIKIAINAIENGYRTLIAVGGDGTLNEVANGILQQTNCPSADVVLGMIPIGSGNDWSRMFNISDHYDKAINSIKNKKLFLQDVGKVSYFNNAKKEERYFVNVAGIGFDAIVVKKTNDQKEKNKRGKLIYLYNIFTSLFSSGFSNATIIIDGKKINSEVFSMNVGICKYNGGGMMQLPEAIADDGLFDITVIKNISKFDVIKNVKNLYNGSFTKHPKVDTYRATKVTITTNPPVTLEADGESLGTSPFSFEIIPRCLTIITGF